MKKKVLTNPRFGLASFANADFIVDAGNSGYAPRLSSESKVLILKNTSGTTFLGEGPTSFARTRQASGSSSALARNAVEHQPEVSVIEFTGSRQMRENLRGDLSSFPETREQRPRAPSWRSFSGGKRIIHRTSREHVQNQTA